VDATPRASEPERSTQRPLRDGLGFFGRFLRNPTSVGAVLPSSRYLSRALVGRLDMAAGDLLVAPSGVPHGVHNTSDGRLLVLVFLAPAP
jgi:phospholipid N-methyltransferase